MSKLTLYVPEDALKQGEFGCACDCYGVLCDECVFNYIYYDTSNERNPFPKNTTSVELKVYYQDE